MLMKPVIINKDSNFVVVTYWWGRGRENKNTQLPCPEDLLLGQALTQKPETYNKMIADWKRQVRKANCNYMAVEYPNFAKKGYYQRAINFKPRFILEALKACKPRGVLYMDGDMDLKKYPHIFDIPDVDYMAQGWNADARIALSAGESPCFYPYVFETSGGTMYFNNTPKSLELLKNWELTVRKNPLKADDRLISQLFNRQQLLTSINVIQLPIEYLWFTQEYPEELERKYWNGRRIYITHPACLTDEERAQAQGASTMRHPAYYESQITNLIKCSISKVPFYEYIFFPKKSYVRSMAEYLKVMSNLGFLNVIPYSERYGPHNSQYNNNLAKMKRIRAKNIRGLVYVSYNNKNVGATNVHEVNRGMDIIPTILKYLRRGNNVIYVPPNSSKNVINRVRKLAQRQVEFMARNRNQGTARYKKSYKLSLDSKYPIYFNADSTVLKHLLSMSKTLSSITTLFNYFFLSRIRCDWI